MADQPKGPDASKPGEGAAANPEGKAASGETKGPDASKSGEGAAAKKGGKAASGETKSDSKKSAKAAENTKAADSKTKPGAAMAGAQVTEGFEKTAGTTAAKVSETAAK